MRFSSIAHGSMAIMNPIGDAVLDDLVEQLQLAPGARVLDLGCGKGEALRRIVERYAAEGTGVELAASTAADARHTAAVVTRGSMAIVEGDALAYRSEHRFDLVMALGAGWPHRFGEIVDLLVAHVIPGGLVLVADTFWQSGPTDEYLALLGASRDDMASHRDNVYAGTDRGLTPVWSHVASSTDWQRYEMGYLANVERWAAAHPDDPDAPAFVSYARMVHQRYLRGGREQLGFGIYLFRAPA